MIDGGGVITISGGRSVDIFSVNAGIKFTVQNLTNANSNAYYGGGVNNRGTLTIINCTFSGNSASDANSGSSGGGIYNEGVLTVTNSTFSGNSASDGSGGHTCRRSIISWPAPTLRAPSASWGRSALWPAPTLDGFG